LGAALDQIGAAEALRDACLEAAVDRRIRPAQVTRLDPMLFPGASTPAGAYASNAMRGLLLALGMAHAPGGGSPQPLRGHLFYHNLQNLWACCNPACSALWPEQVLARHDRTA